jgi:Flp pilus assembly protein TadD
MLLAKSWLSFPGRHFVARQFRNIDRNLALAAVVHRSACLCLLVVAGAVATFGQMPNPNAAHKFGAASVDVRIVGANGQPLDVPARVTLQPQGDPSAAQQMTANNANVEFARLLSGRYTLLVTMPGYKTSDSEIEVMDFGRVDTSVTMEPDDDPSTSVGAMGIVLAPKARKEVDDGMTALRAGKYDQAQQHLEAAYKLAPGNPDVNDLLGELFLVTKNFDKAQQYIQQALSLDPNNVNALVDMGQLRIQQRDFAGAQPSLEKAVNIAPQNSYAHWYLGITYLDLKLYEKARLEATAAIKSGKGTVSGAQFLLGQALAGLGRTADAIAILQSFVHDTPNDFYAMPAKDLIARLQAPPPPSASVPAQKPQ